jgi:hypothetical protein
MNGVQTRLRYRPPDGAAAAFPNGERNGWHRPPAPEAIEVRTEDRNRSWFE